jgi:ACS family glucarate transporter-like MFS transporter
MKKNVTSLLGSKRMIVALLLFAMIFINYVDRVNLSMAAPLISKEMGWDPATMGWILSSFSWTYAIFLIPMGWLVDRLGARKISAISFTVWTFSSILTGSVFNVGTMIAARLLLGIGESAAYPASGKVVRQWFPKSERGIATSIYNSGAYAAPALTTPIVAWVVVATGWRVSFLVIGLVGFIWLAFWLKLFRTPDESKWVSQEEKTFIIENRENENSQVSNPVETKGKGFKIIAALLRQKTLWGLAFTQGCAVYAQYLFLTWLPSYLVQQRHMELIKAGFYGAVPYLVAVILGIYFGKISDRVLTPELLKKGGRRKLVVVFMFLSSIVLFTNEINNTIGIIILLSISLAAISSSISLNFALTNDLIRDSKITGTMMGLVTLGGNIFGLLAPIVTGYIVKATGNFNSAFILAGILLILGGLASLTLSKKPVVYNGSNSEVKTA